MTQRKCWFLGPKDETTLKAALQARAEASSVRTASEGPAAPSPSAQSAPLPRAGEAEGGDVQPFAPAAEPGIPFLVHWSDLLQSAGIIDRENAAMTAWAMQERAIREPATTGARSGEDEQPPETAAGRSDISNGATATLVRMLLIVIAALLIAGGLCQAIFSIARARRRRAYRRKAAWRATGADERAPAIIAQPHPRDLEAGSSASAHQYDGDDGVGPADIDDLQRILRALECHAA